MYKIGDEVSYGLHGKCVITAIETKELASGPVDFYQIKVIKNPIMAKTMNPNTPHILIPVESARSKGLRPLMAKQEAEEMLQLLSKPESDFSMELTWVTKQKLLEEMIRKEGAVGLAKVVRLLYVVIKTDAVPPSEIIRFYENVLRILVRELSEALGQASKDVETLISRALKNKLSQ